MAQQPHDCLAPEVQHVRRDTYMRAAQAAGHKDHSDRPYVTPGVLTGKWMGSALCDPESAADCHI
jgi:hypothetical protein